MFNKKILNGKRDGGRQKRQHFVPTLRDGKVTQTFLDLKNLGPVQPVPE